ncbi:MAG: hypothetical protein V4757_07070 [Pseudomonadota bacterium]
MYQLQPTGVLRLSDGTTIPADPENRDYQSFLAWEEENIENVAAPYEPPPVPVPLAISMRQARLALLEGGHLAAVDAAVNALQGAQGQAARIEWEYATEVRRDNALLAALTPGLGLDAAALDALFTAAAAL